MAYFSPLKHLRELFKFSYFCLPYSAMNTNKKIRKRRAHPPIAPTMSGKNEDCPLELSFVGSMVGFVVVGGDVGSDDEKVSIEIKQESR